MTPAQLITRAAAEGVNLTVEGHRVRCQPGPGAELLVELRQGKDQILAWLRLLKVLGRKQLAKLDDLLDERGWLESHGSLPPGIGSSNQLLEAVARATEVDATSVDRLVDALYALEVEADSHGLREFEATLADEIGPVRPVAMLPATTRFTTSPHRGASVFS